MTEPRTGSEPLDQTTIEDLPRAPEYRPTTTVSSNPAGSVDSATGAVTAPPATGRRGFAVRWLVALLGIVVVAAGSFVVVSLAGGRPATSVAAGYMPDSVTSYVEARLDLPGDQRQKVASFLHTGGFPGFADQANITPKIEDIYDRVVRLASHDQQTYTADIQPWFGGTIAVGQAAPTTTAGGALNANPAAASEMTGLVVLTITDRAKTVAYVTTQLAAAKLERSSYHGADLFTTKTGASNQPAPGAALAITDKVLLAGPEAEVQAAVDSQGTSAFATNPDVKAALATVDQDYVVLTISRLRATFQALASSIASQQPGVLERSQIDETLLKMVPAWTAATGRFEDDSFVFSSASPPWSIGVDTKNAPSDLLGHVPANTIFYSEVHDVGPALTGLIGTFRALPETKTFFDQFDQALAMVGGGDAVYGWWDDTALVVAPNADGTVGGGLVIHPRDPDAPARLLTVLRSDLGLVGASAGVTVRDEDHNGTKITILDFSGAMAKDASPLPPGVKPEIAWATNQDVTVLGYGRDFVASVLDAGPGHSLADDARFKALIGRVGTDNLAASFVDLTALRKLLEPLMQRSMTPQQWTTYTTEVQPFLAPFDAVVGVSRSDGTLDRGTSVVTVH